jgi:hypothetical protein
MPAAADTPRVQISLELERGDHPISGTLHTGREGTREFTGWLELISLLEQLRAEPLATSTRGEIT